MKDSEIVKKFLERGILISPKILEKIDSSNINFYIKKAVDGGCIIFNTINTNPDIVVDIKKSDVKDVIDIDNFTQYVNKKFNSLKKILMERIEPVSINNSKNIFSIVSIIGMVKEIGRIGFTVEDETGSIDVISKHKPTVGDVIGITGYVKEGKLFAQKITYPDVPESNRLKKIDGVKIFLTKKFTNENTPNFTFAEEGNINSKNIFTNFTSPSRIMISKGNNIINILFFRPELEMTADDAILCLIKRYLPGDMKISGVDKSFFILDILPDIFWISGRKKWSRNYRNVTIISCGDGGALIDLGKREVEFTADPF